MPLTAAEIAAAAAALAEAQRTGRQTALLSLRHPAMDMDDAYAVQAAFTAAKLAAGRRVVGWKIGLTSRAMQDALGIDTPDSGSLLDDMAFEAGATIPAGRFIQPRIEAEIAFLVARPITGPITREAVLAATASVAPALEILDTRILRADPQTGRRRTIVDTIADNAANAGFVLGPRRHDPTAVDLRRVGAIVRRDGTVEETGLGAGVLDDPVSSVLWLARRLARYGQRIEPGHVILSGSFVRPIECTPGSRIEADFGPFGNVSVAFD
jgi:2-oxo-hept-3-ene-1,7-dioate hydratase